MVILDSCVGLPKGIWGDSEQQYRDEQFTYDGINHDWSIWDMLGRMFLGDLIQQYLRMLMVYYGNVMVRTIWDSWRYSDSWGLTYGFMGIDVWIHGASYSKVYFHWSHSVCICMYATNIHRWGRIMSPGGVRTGVSAINIDLNHKDLHCPWWKMALLQNREPVWS